MEPLLKKQRFHHQVYKPGSVLTAIYLVLQLLTRSSRLLRSGRANHMLLHGVASDRVYIVKPMSPWAGCALTAPFHPYCVHPKELTKRYLSVALVLGSPPAGVTRYPCPAKPGLSSRSAFRHFPAAVQPGGGNIVTHEMQIVKHLAKSSRTGYTIISQQGNGEYYDRL